MGRWFLELYSISMALDEWWEKTMKKIPLEQPR